MSFAKDLAMLCQRAGERAEIVARKVALDLHGQMIERTPVDTGRAKGAWQVGVGAIDKSEGAPDVSGTTALVRGAAKMEQWKPGQTIWITNHLPYAYRLEHGWSKQAPGGMVRLAVQNYAQAVAKAARELK